MNAGSMANALVLDANNGIVSIMTAGNHGSRDEIPSGCKEKEQAKERTSNPAFRVEHFYMPQDTFMQFMLLFKG